MEHLSVGIMKKFRLNLLMERPYIRLPKGVKWTDDLDYLVSFCFALKYDPRRQVDRMYRRIENRELQRFPKAFFMGAFGQEHAQIVLHDFIQKNIAAPTIADLYLQFADTAKMNKLFLREHIYYACHGLYRTPLEFLHATLSDNQRDEFLYNALCFTADFKAKYKELTGKDFLKTVSKKKKK